MASRTTRSRLTTALKLAQQAWQHAALRLSIGPDGTNVRAWVGAAFFERDLRFTSRRHAVVYGRLGRVVLITLYRDGMKRGWQLVLGPRWWHGRRFGRRA